MKSKGISLSVNRKTLPIAAGICGFAMSVQASLVAHYKFDEAEDAEIAANEVAGSSPGEVGSFVTTGVEGISGNAYRFEGVYAENADIVDMGNASFLPALAASGRLTFAAWIKTSDTTGNRNTVIFAGDDTAMNVYADLGVAAGQSGAEGSASARNRPVGAAAGGQQTGIFSSPILVNDDEWHHLAMTVDLSTATLALYVDGALANTQVMPSSSTALPVFNNFEIGRLGRSSPVDPFEGLVDDVQVYSRALSEDEVRFLYENPGVPAPEPARITGVSFAPGGDYTIHFAGEPNATYEVTKSTALDAFAPMDPPVTATTDGSGAGVATVPAGQASGSRGFFRLETP